MKRFLLAAVIIIAFGTASLSAQTEFIDQFGIGLNYGFFDEKDNPGTNFFFDYMLGAHLHKFDKAILAGIRFNGFNTLDVGAQIDFFNGFFEGRKLIGYGWNLAGGVQFLGEHGALPYARVGGFWHFAAMIKCGLELDYRFGGQLSVGLILTVPSATVYTRLDNFDRIYVRGRSTSQQTASQKQPSKTSVNGEYIIIILNQLTIPITQISLSPAGREKWAEQLEDETVDPEKGWGFDLPSPGIYDVKVEDSEGNTYTFYNQDFTGGDGESGRMLVVDDDKKD